MKKIVLLLVTAIVSLSSDAQVNPELNGLIRQSFTYYPKLQELNKATEISEIRIGLAESGYLPALSGTGSYSYLTPVGQISFPISATETRTIQFQPHNNYNFNIGLNQIIWDFGKTQSQIEKAKADMLVSKQNTEAAKLQLASQVVNIYYSLVYLRKAMMLQDTVIATYEKNRRVIEGKIRQGDALKVDLSNIDNQISQEKNHSLDFQRQYDRQMALLAYTTGQSVVPANTEFDFEMTVPSQELSLQANPEILAADQKITAAQADAKAAQRNRLPSLNLNASAGMRNGYQPDIEEIRFNYLAGVTLNVPIFQGNRIRQNISLARKSVQLSEISRTNLNASLQKDWRSAQADLTAYEEQIKNTETQIDATKEALRLTQVRYERGVATYLDLVYATTAMQRSLLSQLQYKYQACLAKAELARLQGTKFWQE